MATTFTSATLQGTYDDDFDQDKHFHQILFNSGRALQARELTQLQTLIYKELGRLGRNIFKEGAAVSSGGMSINSSYEYVKIASTNAGGGFEDIPVGTVFRDPNTLIEARVLEVRPKNTTIGFTRDTLYVQYIDAGDQVIASTPARFGDDVTLLDQSGGGYELTTENVNASGRGVKIDVETGDFFVLGRFVNASRQSLILNPYDQSFTGAVGFKVVQEVVTVNDDTSLYDNTGGVTNTASPGADRYRITLTLVDKADTTSDDTFLFLSNIENSTIVEKVDEDDAYNKINNLLATRTSEESGDYVVDPFIINYQDDPDDADKLDLVVSAGTAYVGGYRVENPSPLKLSVPKPQSTDTQVNDVVPINYGNYFLVDSGQGTSILDLGEVTLGTVGTDPESGTRIGTARIRAVEKITGNAGLLDGATHKVFVTDVKVDAGQDISQVRSIGTSTDYYSLRINSSETKAKLYETQGNSLLFPTTRPRVASIGTDIVLREQRFVNAGSVSSGTVNIDAELGAGETFVDREDWIVSLPGISFVSFTGTGGDIDVDTAYNGQTLKVLYYVQKTATLRSKTLVENITNTLNLVESDGTKYYKFPQDHVDIFDVDSVRNTDASGINMINAFTLDDGQRDNFYTRGRLILDTNDSAPNQIYVKYSRLSHGATGDFFAASSYNGLSYAQIPTHVTANGDEVNLFNFVDFRSTKLENDDNDGGTFSSTYLNELPRVGDDITADIEYYLPRNDKLLVTQDGEVQLLMGQQSQTPQFKPTPDNALELYKIQMNPNTINENDLSFTQIDHPHYTMKDIAELEAKVDRLEEYTRLSILELQQRLSPSYDSAGNERVEVGTVVDDATDHSRTDTENPDHCASIDPESGIIRPCAVEGNIKLKFDSDTSTGVIRKGDQVYLTYDEEEWAYQDLASTSVQVNPFGSTQNIGTLKLSPSSDEWKESYTAANRAIKGRDKLSDKQAQLWNNWQWNWQGRSSDDQQNDTQYCGDAYARSGANYNDKSDKYYSSYSNAQRFTGGVKHVTRVVASNTLRARFGNRYVDYALVPWMRSRKIYFKATGLKPNTKFTPFFDGIDVSDWVKEEAFVRWSERDDEIGNRYGNQTQHPDTPSELVSDANGEITGSFFIPSSRYGLPEIRRRLKYLQQGKTVNGFTVRPRFRAGVREFMLLDIDTPDWEEAGSKCFNYYSNLGFALHFLRWRGLRHHSSTVPYSYLSKRARTYTAKEIKERLDNIASGNINLIDPQKSGLWSGSTTPLTGADLSVISSTNSMSSVLSDYITVNKNQQASSTVAPQNTLENPLAQTFYVDNPFGLTLTKIQLYFRTKDTGNLPVSIEVRPVVDGKPSEDIIVPDSQVFLNPSQVDAIGTDPVLSTVQGRPTTFEFEEPIFLQPNWHYAIVVKSASTQYEIFSAKTQQPVLGSTGRTVTTQPIPGSLFLPQNGTTWQESKDQDLMYRLVRAKFNNTNGSVVLQNAALPKKELDYDYIYTTESTGIVVIKQDMHGLKTGDTVTLEGATDVNGITAAQLNATHTITAASANRYGFTISGASATATGRGGNSSGNGVRADENLVFHVANLQLEHAIPRSTSVDTSAKFTTAQSASGSQTAYVKDSRYQRITPAQNIDFTSPRGIFPTAVETAQLGAGEKSLVIKVDLKSGNDYVSPIIDLQRTSMITVGYAIDDPAVTPDVLADIPETSPYGCTGASRHITKPVELIEPAVGIDARVDANIPEDAEVDFYYRTCGADEDLWVQPWVKQEPIKTLPKVNDGVTFNKLEHLPGGQGGTLKPFYKAQTKYVMRCKELPPALRAIRTRYLAV